jgi:subtilase family serine protease
MLVASGLKTMCPVHRYSKRGTHRLSHWCYGCALALLAILTRAEAVCAQTRVDLEVESVQVGSARLSKNEKVEITASVRNNGSEPAEKVFLQVDVKQDGKRIKAINAIPVLSHLPRLGVGQSIPISLGQLPSGSYESVVMVDPAHLIDETNETNNQRSIRFNVY